MYNDTKTIYNKELIIGIRKGGKKVKIRLEINQEAENRTAHTTTHETISGYKTFSMCGDGGQNIEQIEDVNNYKELFISEDDLKAIVSMWKRWHLNDMNAGTKRQKEYTEELKKQGFKYDYSLACEKLKKVNLYIDNGYKYGSEWLVESLPEDVIKEITDIFEKYNDTKNIEQKTNKAKFNQFEIKASFKGDKKAPWSDDNFNNHMVKVVNTDTGLKVTFEYWASIASPKLETEQEVLNAFYNFVEDAVAGSGSFEEFCSDFGYDIDDKTAGKTWRKCQKSYVKLQKIYDGDACDLVNELQEACD